MAGLENADLMGYADLLQDILSAQRRLRETHSALERIIIKPAQTDIYWASVNRQSSDIGVHAAPCMLVISCTRIFRRVKL